ncbi:MAG: extracellular solute-binding protein [Hyphomicrobium sp.]|nr:extracellular solute-binding protein [Hyphomicrobium sp.]
MTKSRDSNALQLSRRRFLGTTAAGVAAAALPAIPALAQSKDLVVGNWGGDWNDRVVRAFEKPLLEDKGYKIVRELSQAPERKTKLVAEKRLPRGTLDIAHLTDADAYEMDQQEVLEKLDTSKMPNFKHVRENLRSPYFMPWVYGGVVILYNPKKISEPPTSFADLWNPKYAGRVGVIDQIYFNYIYLAALAAGGTLKDVKPGLEKLKQLKVDSKPRIYPAHQQLAAAFASEEIWISANYTARALQWENDGLPVKLAHPKEGAIAITFGVGIPRKARNKDAAYAYLDAMLDPGVMAEMAKVTYYAPAVDNASLTPELSKRIDFTPEQVSKLHFVDYPYAAKNSAAWLEWWNKEFKSA